MVKIQKFFDEEKKEIHSGRVIDSSRGYDVIECNECGFKHVIPLPTKDELKKLYEKEFYSQKKPNYFKYVEEDLEWWMQTYNSYYKLFERYTKGRRILDIGSGPGYFLKCGKQTGWDTLGIDPSPEACEYSGKLGVKTLNIFFTGKEIDSLGLFDVVFMDTLLEHIPYPVDLIENTRKVLKPGGLLCVISPNEYNPLQKILREKLGFSPWWVAPPQHLNYFDFSSMKLLFNENGFEVLETLGTFPMEFFLLAGINYVGDDKIGRKCHAGRKELELNLLKHGGDILPKLYEFFASCDIGRKFFVLGKKT